MKLLCTLFSIFSLPFVSYAAPTETSLYDMVTDSSGFYETNVTEEDEEYIGKPCTNHTCSEKLLNVKCDESSKTCECESDYPVQLSKNRGCVKSSSLGEQCMYGESCIFDDPFSTCVQVSHNAYCQCIEGYHVVSNQKSSRKDFCSKDILQIAKDLPTLLLVISSVAVFSTLICFVLKLFVGKSRRYQNSAITTRLLSASEIAQVARTFRQSNRCNTYSRRGSRGVTVSSSRATAARAAAILLVSCHIPPHEQQAVTSTRKSSADGEIGNDSTSGLQRSSSNSPRSFSAKQFKRESDQKLARHRALQNQASASSLMPITSPKKLVQKRAQSSSLNNLKDVEEPIVRKTVVKKPYHLSLTEVTHEL